MKRNVYLFWDVELVTRNSFSSPFLATSARPTFSPFFSPRIKDPSLSCTLTSLRLPPVLPVSLHISLPKPHLFSGVTLNSAIVPLFLRCKDQTQKSSSDDLLLHKICLHHKKKGRTGRRHKIQATLPPLLLTDHLQIVFFLLLPGSGSLDRITGQALPPDPGHEPLHHACSHQLRRAATHVAAAAPPPVPPAASAAAAIATAAVAAAATGGGGRGVL